LLRAQAQFTNDRLLSLEKFAIGGFATVRGYRENQLVRDNGWATSAEFRAPIGTFPVPHISDATEGQLDVATFVDFGRSWDTDVPSPDPTSLYSVGLGLRWQVSERLAAHLYYAYPLNDLANPADHDLQDDGIHFRLGATLF
jgi:hemolysin activation/secretion protein